MPVVIAKVSIIKMEITLKDQEGKKLAKILDYFIDKAEVESNNELRQFAGNLRESMYKYIPKE